MFVKVVEGALGMFVKVVEGALGMFVKVVEGARADAGESVIAQAAEKWLETWTIWGV